MARAGIDGITLEYEDSGVGEPVITIHGALIADVFRLMLAESSLADRYRLISYHRRGYGGSSGAEAVMTFTDAARDCRRLLSHLGVARAHVVGHSYGAAVALQLAVETPEIVHTLSLLEAALLVRESAPSYRSGLAQSHERYRKAGGRVALEEFLEPRWPTYREDCERMPGALEQAEADAATFFEAELPSFLDSHFDETAVRGATQPVLVVLGVESLRLHPRFGETFQLLQEWLPDAEGLVLPDSTHFLPVEQLRAMAEALVEFLARHRLEDERHA